MSLLFPLYLAGLAAVSLPIVFHLIRRTPSGRTPFSSLMFLRTSPPRLVRRKSLDNIALLSLRALVLAILALAFARPFLRIEDEVLAGGGRGPSVAVLLDTSASMRRPGLWEEAMREVEDVLGNAPDDAVLSLSTFDRELSVLVSTQDAERLSGDGGVALVREQLASLTPTWERTDVGKALATLADRLNEQDEEAGQDEADRPPSTIVLVSDLQRGTDVSELEGYDWPERVHLEVRRVATSAENAALHPVPVQRAGAEDSELRVRISNSADSSKDRFELRWESNEADSASALEGETVFCPPGESRVVRAPPKPPESADAPERLVLSGDDCPFDNVLYDRPGASIPIEVLSIGAPDVGEDDMDFFLGSVFGDRPGRRIEVVTSLTLPPLDVVESPLVVVELGASGLDAEALLDHARDGGVVFGVLGTPIEGGGEASVQQTLRTLLGDEHLGLVEADTTRGFSLLGEIDFEHPLFAPFTDPRYSDFTKIHFWRHRWLELSEPTDGVAELRVLARFDDDGPFLVEREVGYGRVLIATSSWGSDDSDLGLSSKFAPLLHGMLRLGPELDVSTQSFLVGDRVPLRVPDATGVRVRQPDGRWMTLEAGATAFTETGTPGPYEVRIGERASHFTIRLDPEESRTDPAVHDTLSRIGVPIVNTGAHVAAPEESRQVRSLELESRQKLWRWLTVIALLALLFETVWAGRLARRTETPAGQKTPAVQKPVS